MAYFVAFHSQAFFSYDLLLLSSNPGCREVLILSAVHLVICNKEANEQVEKTGIEPTSIDFLFSCVKQIFL